MLIDKTSLEKKLSKAEIIKRFRGVAWGRLYWKSNNPRMRRFMSDDICLVKSGTSCIHYQCLSALIEDIELGEEYQKC